MRSIFGSPSTNLLTELRTFLFCFHCSVLCSFESLKFYFLFVPFGFAVREGEKKEIALDLGFFFLEDPSLTLNTLLLLKRVTFQAICFDFSSRLRLTVPTYTYILLIIIFTCFD